MSEPMLSKLNSLILLDSGVWVKAEEKERSFIDYSDGDSVEEQVYKLVHEAEDKSVYSEALDQPWDEWALEYHLGSKRSNIYRGLNLSESKTVLEVGCGCGAITRYLGECGFEVDAIEGTLRRAEIARLRTEALDNVQIISSNYHDLVLGKNSYDLIVFTGVLEYSGAYAEKGVSPEAQLKATLKHAQAALSEKGQILIAIENRTGFKYLAGAGEDHLSVPNIGLLDYVEPKSKAITRGIRTWSKKQWSQIIDELGFAAHQFCYPFPDYKVPDAILSDNFLQHTEHPEQVLGGICSRDYLKIWQPQLPEALFWRAAAQTKCLDEFANSFLIVVAASDKQLQKTIDFDFVRFASLRRKLPYRQQVSKMQSAPDVTRTLLAKTASSEAGVVLHHVIENEAYVEGALLEQTWRNALMVVPTYEELGAQLQAYFDWLSDLPVKKLDLYVDALPQNIIVDSENNWHLIDQEWQARQGISQEVILFRALFYFALNAREVLAELEVNAAQSEQAPTSEAEFPLIQTVEDFIRWGFTLASMDYPANREACLAFELNLQTQVTRKAFQVDLHEQLAAPIFQWHALQQLELPQTPLEIRAYWTQVEGAWHPDHSVASKVSLEHGLGASLDLPEMLISHRYLRVNPAADRLHIFRGYLQFHGLGIVAHYKNGTQQTLFEINTAAELFQIAKCKGMQLVSGDRVVLVSVEAYFVLDLVDVEWGSDVASIQLDVQFDLYPIKSIVSARQLLREQSMQAANRVKNRQNILDRYQERIADANVTLEQLESKIDKMRSENMRNRRFNRLLSKFGLMRKPQ